MVRWIFSAIVVLTTLFLGTAQNVDISGKIVDPAGNAVSGAQVYLYSDSAISDMSDATGSFSLTNEEVALQAAGASITQFVAYSKGAVQFRNLEQGTIIRIQRIDLQGRTLASYGPIKFSGKNTAIRLDLDGAAIGTRILHIECGAHIWNIKCNPLGTKRLELASGVRERSLAKSLAEEVDAIIVTKASYAIARKAVTSLSSEDLGEIELTPLGDLEQVANGTFSGGDVLWTVPYGWSIEDGAAKFTGNFNPSGNGPNIRCDPGLIPGQKYVLEYDAVFDSDTGSISCFWGKWSQGCALEESGHAFCTGTVPDPVELEGLRFYPYNGFAGTIDNISLKTITNTSVYNGDFAEGSSYWQELGKGWTFENGAATHDGTADTSDSPLRQYAVLEGGATYILSFDITTSSTTGNMRYYVGSWSTYASANSSGHVVDTITVPNPVVIDYVQLHPYEGFSFTIDNVELTKN